MEKKVSDVAALGGHARAKRLTREQRSLIARNAAEARWGALPVETHTGTVRIGDIEIPCAVLDDEQHTRVFSTRGVTRAVGGKKTGTGGGDDGAPKLPPFLSSNAIKPFVSEELMARLLNPVQYQPKHGGRSAFGYEATLLPRLCSVLIDADRAGKLRANQKHLGATADILLRGFAEVGIIALVDEATGFQDDRARDALARILEAFVAKELRQWVRTFPPEFYKQMFRLRGLPYNGSVKRPGYIGHLTNDVVYARLAPGVLKELREKNPVVEGRRRHRHFQWLTDDIGHPKLQEHLVKVTTLMQVSDTWDGFKVLLERAARKYSELPLFKDIQDFDDGKT